jgi:hypothetical protein
MTRALDKLMQLRRLREEQALNELAKREQETVRMQGEVEASAAALTEHKRSSSEREHSTLAQLMGQRLNTSRLVNLQSSLNASDDHRKILREKELEAQRGLKAKQEDVRRARSAFWLRHKQAEKLAALVGLEEARKARKQLAADEIEDEDINNRIATLAPKPFKT